MTTHVSEQDFLNNYKPIAKPGTNPSDGDYLWEHKDTLSQPFTTVWTVVEDGDSNGAYAVPGYHIVNKVDYVVTEVPWDDDDIEAVWWEPRLLCKHCRERLDEDHKPGDPWLHEDGGRQCEDADPETEGTFAEPEDPDPEIGDSDVQDQLPRGL